MHLLLYELYEMNCTVSLNFNSSLYIYLKYLLDYLIAFNDNKTWRPLLSLTAFSYPRKYVRFKNVMS